MQPFLRAQTHGQDNGIGWKSDGSCFFFFFWLRDCTILGAHGNPKGGCRVVVTLCIVATTNAGRNKGQEQTSIDMPIQGPGRRRRRRRILGVLECACCCGGCLETTGTRSGRSIPPRPRTPSSFGSCCWWCILLWLLRCVLFLLMCL